MSRSIRFNRLAQSDLGSQAESVRKGYRKLNVGSHRIYYRQRGIDIEIMRVLHERVDVKGRI